MSYSSSPTRQVKSLKWAKPCSRPSHIPISRPRGTKALGIRFENQLAKHLTSSVGRQIVHGQWFEFEDSSGHHYCQPDFLLPHSDRIVILESKLTWTPFGDSQLLYLYCPIVSAALSCKAIPIQVVRNLPTDLPVTCVADTIPQALESHTSVIQWLGQPLFPTPLAAGKAA